MMKWAFSQRWSQYEANQIIPQEGLALDRIAAYPFVSSQHRPTPFVAKSFDPFLIRYARSKKLLAQRNYLMLPVKKSLKTARHSGWQIFIDQ